MEVASGSTQFHLVICSEIYCIRPNHLQLHNMPCFTSESPKININMISFWYCSNLIPRLTMLYVRITKNHAQQYFHYFSSCRICYVYSVKSMFWMVYLYVNLLFCTSFSYGLWCYVFCLFIQCYVLVCPTFEFSIDDGTVTLCYIIYLTIFLT